MACVTAVPVATAATALPQTAADAQDFKSTPVKQQKQPQQSISSLPDEVLLNIFGHASLHDLLALSQVCRRWNAIGSEYALWRRVTFTMAQFVSIPAVDALMIDGHPDESNPAPYGSSGVHTAVSAKVKQRLTLALKGRAEVWYLRAEKAALHYLVCWAMPSARFIRTNARFGNGRFTHVRTLNLSHQGDRVESYFLKEILFPAMPNLASVDLSGCSMVGNSAVEALVDGHERGKRTLEVIKLAKCFALTAHAASCLSRCRRLRVLDLGDGCGAAQQDGLVHLVSEDGEEDGEPSALVRTLEHLDISRGDFISERMLLRFLRKLTLLPPSLTRLCRIDLSGTYCVSPDVLDHIYSDRQFKSSSTSSVSGSITSPPMKRALEIDVRHCDLLTRQDVENMVKRLNGHRQTDAARFGCLTDIVATENCKLPDNSSESVLRYLQSIRPAHYH